MVAIVLFMLAIPPVTPLVRNQRPVDVIQIVERGPEVPGRSFTATWKVMPADTAAPRSPYRIPASVTVDPTSKDRAFDQDGARCALIGQTICTDPPPVLMTVGEKPFALLPELAPR
jgi:hypothetical protein